MILTDAEEAGFCHVEEHTAPATISGESAAWNLVSEMTSWLDGTQNRERKQHEEWPWYSSLFGRPEKVRERWNYVLHSSAERLPHHTYVAQPWIVTKHLVSSKSDDHVKKNNEPASSKVAGTLDEELHHLYAVGIAAWKQQEYAWWPEEGTSAWS